MRAAGKAQLLELGGNGPMVILEDADLELAAAAALEAAYLCAGQSCTAGERFLVHAAVRAEFTERVVAATKASVRLGDPFDPRTTMGPLNNEATAAKFDRHIADAVAGGARVCCGGRRADRLPDPALRRADRARRGHPGHGDRAGGDVRAGRAGGRGAVGGRGAGADQRLAVRPDRGGVHRGPGAGLAFAERARAGWVNINASTNLWESHLPFGGRAGSVSGRGRVGGGYPMDTFTEPKTVTFPAPRLRPA